MKKFKTQSHKMLDMMINSIYTNREIFVRELLSNASDAIDKLYYNSLQDGNSGFAREDFNIKIEIDKDNRIITFTDNGIGMTQEQLEKNLGTIAQSDSYDFKKDKKDEDINIIGQFGVGFYSVFMVSKKVEVYSKPYNSDKAFCWKSSGVEGYEITPCEMQENGTKVVLHLKDNKEEDSYDEFLKDWHIKELVKKYSNYINYPIKMMTEEYDEEGKEKSAELTVINDMIPLWKKRKTDITDEEYNDFYTNMFYDSEAPLATIHTTAEGAVDYKALLFIPSHTPYDYYSKNYEKGLRLYTSGVMIMEKSSELIPDYFGFVKGLVDSELSLNISRETIQNDRRLKAIAKSIEKKIKAELLSMLNNDRAKYEKFYEAFGQQIKYGIYSSWGTNKEMLQDLIMFHSIKQDKMITLQQYVDAMNDEQKFIYYANAKSVEGVKALPQTERIIDSGYDVLCFTQEVDEFAIKVIKEFASKQFRSAFGEDLGIEDKVEQEETCQELINAIKESLGDKVEKVKLSNRLKNHAVCLTSEGEFTLEMEKVFAQMPDSPQGAVKAKKVLEINPNHKLFGKIQQLNEQGNKELLGKYAEIMLDQALMIQGMKVENRTSMAETIFDIIAN